MINGFEYTCEYSTTPQRPRSWYEPDEWEESESFYDKVDRYYDEMKDDEFLKQEEDEK